MRVRLPRGLVRLARVASTPAVAAAEKAGIEFSLHEYDHDPAAEHERIMVSAGHRGLQIELSPDDFVLLTGARVHPIAGH